MNEPGFPCPLCGAARSCKHRTAPAPIRVDIAPPPRNGGNAGRYKLPRGAYNGLHARINRTGSPVKSRI